VRSVERVRQAPARGFGWRQQDSSRVIPPLAQRGTKVLVATPGAGSRHLSRILAGLGPAGVGLDQG